ncbi:hypothetical protein PR248_03310 [Metamycoplasma hyosynoviae]|nr:hypothetical protein [Metamycoplasma hyosynoviae]MDC8914052.1 hypothetical protein [Metamycoplasma hyosynoviae]
MKNKKIFKFLIPYFVVLSLFLSYLILMAILTRTNKFLYRYWKPLKIFWISEAFILVPSFLSQPLLIFLVFTLFINIYFIRKHLKKNKIEITKENKKKILKILLTITICSFLTVLILNLMIVFIKQNYQIEKFKPKTPLNSEIENITILPWKIVEFSLIYLFRLSYWYLLTILLIKFTNNDKKLIGFSFLYLALYLLPLVIIFLLDGYASHLGRTISLFAVSSVLPETMSTWIHNFTPYNDFPGPENIPFLQQIVYIPSFITFSICIAKIKTPEFIYIEKIKKSLKLN